MKPEEVVRAELAAWDHLDVDEIMSHFAADAVWDNVPIRAVSGHDEIRKEVEGFLGSMTSFDAEILNLAVDGNIVLTERVDHMHFGGQLLHARVMGAFEVDGDKVKAWRDYFDMPKEQT
jgi:limonene-1,2-epoxide hydrolase